jgi:hypothetical protein
VGDDVVPTSLSLKEGRGEVLVIMVALTLHVKLSGGQWMDGAWLVV